MDVCDTDPDMALEFAIQNLGGEDSETEEVETTEACTFVEADPRSDGTSSTLLEEEQDQEGTGELTRETTMPRIYSPSPAPVSEKIQLRKPVTLDTIIQDTRLFNLFMRFLKDQCTTRNLNFWLACEHYKKLVPSDGQQHIYEVAKALYVKFIKSSATQRVTLLEQTRKNLKMGLDPRRITPNLFIEAQQDIWGVMNKNELRQFLLSGVVADCPSYANLADNSSLSLSSVYTPSMANPALGVCGGGSLQHSGSEDSASLSSFSTESDRGPRSYVMQQLSRPFPTSRNAISDCEDHKPRPSHRRGGTHHSSTEVSGKEKPVTEERFVALVVDRLRAVIKDREGMTQRVRDGARQRKKNYDEIMALEWYDLPEAIKYLYWDSISSEPSNGQLQVPYPKTTTTTTANSNLSPPKDLMHINKLALCEVQAALKDMEITNKVEARRPFSRTSGSGSVLSTTSDSGVGDTMAPSGLVTPHQDRLTQYVSQMDSIRDRTSERERDARAAAMTLMHASPQPESLNPRAPSNIRSNHAPASDRHGRRPYSNFPEAYSSDDSSSCFTMTSHSSASDLFIPKRTTHRSAYSDNDESHHFRGHKRPMAAPRRSTRGQQQHHMAPSPIVEHHQLAPPHPSSSMVAQQPKGHTLVVYHLDQIPTPFAMRVPGTNITLADFKAKVLKRSGEFRYFFKSYLDDVGEFLEECSEDCLPLPLFQGKIIGRVERID